MDTDNPRSYILFDGAIYSNLYLKGMLTDSFLPTYILDNKDLFLELKSQFVESGSDIITAPTALCNKAILTSHSLENDVISLNKELVSLTKSVAKDKKVAGVLGPTTLTLMPYGETTFDELVNIYKEQAKALNDACVDLFYLEAFESLAEARAAIFAVKQFNKPIYVTIKIDENKKTVNGDDALACLISLQNLGIDGFGISCFSDIEVLKETIHSLNHYSKIPLIAIPDAGEQNPILPHLYDLSPTNFSLVMNDVIELGVTIIGGCCGTTPNHISMLKDILKQKVFKAEEQTNTSFSNTEIYLANEQEFFIIDTNTIYSSERIDCHLDMVESFINAEEEGYNVLHININTIDDVKMFMLNYHLAKLPILLYSDNEAALNLVLYLYNGRCMVDSQTLIDSDTLKSLCIKYGAVLY